MLDAFGTANELAAMQQLDSLHFELSLVGVRRRVHTSQGLSVPVQPADSAARPDWVVIPAIGYKMPEPLQRALGRADVADAGALLREWSAAGVNCAAACIGTFVLVESGLLDGRIATTTWWLAPLFRQRYPEVELDDAHMLVSSGTMLTAGAALAHIDMALWPVSYTHLTLPTKRIV